MHDLSAIVVAELGADMSHKVPARLAPSMLTAARAGVEAVRLAAAPAAPARHAAVSGAGRPRTEGAGRDHEGRSEELAKTPCALGAGAQRRVRHSLAHVEGVTTFVAGVAVGGHSGPPIRARLKECQGRSRKSTTSDVTPAGQAIISIGIDVATMYA